MYMTPTELKKIIDKNPAVKIHVQGRTDRRTPIPATELFSKFDAKGKPSKYWNVKVYVYKDGFVSEVNDLPNHSGVSEVYDSRKEYQRWNALSLLERAGKIRNLRRQQTLLIEPSFEYGNEHIRAVTYKADHIYEDAAGHLIVEDTKTFDEKEQKYLMTEVFKLKWKLLKRKYPDYLFRLY